LSIRVTVPVYQAKKLRNGKNSTMVKIPARLLQRRNPWCAATLSCPRLFKEAKPMKRVSFALAAALMLVACGRDGVAENNAEALDRAADQSTPEAADVLRNAADRGANVQEAMQAAGNAQVEAGNSAHNSH
jgi:hypothetical protein